MLKSKALKGSFPYGRRPEMGWIFWLKEHTIWKLESLWDRYTERIGRSYAFAKHGWLSYDFDAGTLWPLIAFKLKRIHPVLVNGHAIQEDEDMNALLEAIAICERLGNDEYENQYYELHNKKYGELDMKSDRVASVDADGKPLTYYCDMSRPGVTPENEAQERAELRTVWENGERDLQADMDRLAFLLKNYSRKWWD